MPQVVRVTGLACAEIELRVGAGSRLLAFDGVTHSLDWSQHVGNATQSPALSDTAHGVCRLAVIDNPGKVLTSRCDEHTFVEAVGFNAAGHDLMWVRRQDESGDLVGTDGRTLLDWSEQTHVVTELGVGAGENAGDDGKGLSWVRDGSAPARLVIASDGELGSFLLRTDVLFANGFERGDRPMSRSAR